MAANADVLVKWAKDNTQNVVSLKDLILPEGENVQKGMSVKMWWQPNKEWWKGSVVAVASDMHINKTDDSDETFQDSDDNIPLADLRKSMVQTISKNQNQTYNDNGNNDTQTNNLSEDELLSEESSCAYDSDKDPLYEYPTNTDQSSDEFESNVNDETIPIPPSVCSNHHCSEEIFAACIVAECMQLLCYNHFHHDSCTDHSANNEESRQPVVSFSSDLQEDQQHRVITSASSEPESFAVDGVEREDNVSPAKRKRSEKEILRIGCKEKRNLGLGYVSEKSGKSMPPRRILKPRCTSKTCRERGLKCDDFDESKRAEINKTYYETGSLSLQREWIVRHITCASPKRSRKPGHTSRKGRTFTYLLPDVNLARQPVCRKLFLNTLNIAERQIRTSLTKCGPSGMLQPEGRGGRHQSLKVKDAKMRADVRRHIDRFPRMESHFCRQSSTQQYLSSELSISKMYDLYKGENTQPTASLSLYNSVFNEMKLKFHTPKKDQCGLCNTFRQGSSEDKDRLRERYERHIREKDKAREIKNSLKERAKVDDNFVIANFDLEQVLFLPTSQRGDLFYKRKLSNYNFTVYELGSGKGQCFLWHEALAGRGSNEIASLLHNFLKEKDKEGVTEVVFFSDGCSGQNKNSILPSMFLFFVSNEANSITSVNLHFFEASHGQSEGDAMHSTVERAMRRAGEVFIPAQLVPIVRMARKDPYIVHEVQTSTILDWKGYSKKIRVLRTRATEEGESVHWTKFMQIKVYTQYQDKIFVKTSHCKETFSTIILHEGRSVGNPENQPRFILPKELPSKAYSSAATRPKLSALKYKDMVSYCQGETPVIQHPDHQAFYMNLPH